MKDVIVKKQKYMEYHFPLCWQKNWDSNEHLYMGVMFKKEWEFMVQNMLLS